MKEFDRLLEVYNALLGPDGCPWDRKQTMASIRCDLLEECHELLEAISLDSNTDMVEELGDVFACLVFLGRLAEKEGRFRLEEALTSVSDKLVRRHPHVFDDAKVETEKEVWAQWDRIKQKEKGKEDRKGIFDGIPATLPALARAQKYQKKLERAGLACGVSAEEDPELALGQQLWELVDQARDQGLEAEQALSRFLSLKEQVSLKSS